MSQSLRQSLDDASKQGAVSSLPIRRGGSWDLIEEDDTAGTVASPHAAVAKTAAFEKPRHDGGDAAAAAASPPPAVVTKEASSAADPTAAAVIIVQSPEPAMQPQAAIAAAAAAGDKQSQQWVAQSAFQTATHDAAQAQSSIFGSLSTAAYAAVTYFVGSDSAATAVAAAAAPPTAKAPAAIAATTAISDDDCGDDVFSSGTPKKPNSGSARSLATDISSGAASPLSSPVVVSRPSDRRGSISHGAAADTAADSDESEPSVLRAARGPMRVGDAVHHDGPDGAPAAAAAAAVGTHEDHPVADESVPAASCEAFDARHRDDDDSDDLALFGSRLTPFQQRLVARVALLAVAVDVVASHWHAISIVLASLWLSINIVSTCSVFLRRADAAVRPHSRHRRAPNQTEARHVEGAVSSSPSDAAVVDAAPSGASVGADASVVAAPITNEGDADNCDEGRQMTAAPSVRATTVGVSGGDPHDGVQDDDENPDALDGPWDVEDGVAARAVGHRRLGPVNKWWRPSLRGLNALITLGAIATTPPVSCC